MLELEPVPFAESHRPSRRAAAGSPAKNGLIFVNRFFHPDRSATAQILSDLAFHLAGNGYSVTALTSRQRYDDPGADLPATEAVNGVVIHRLPATRFGRAAALGRGLDYLSFYAAAWRATLRLAHPGDILVAKTDPPLLCLPAREAARRGGLRLVNWLQDLYPEVAVQLGVPAMRGPVGRGLARLRDGALHAATANVVVGEGMAEIVRTRGVAAERVHVIPNWCADEEIRPVAAPDNPLRREWGLDGRFVVGYSGNLGRAHEFETVLAAAERLRDEPRILFLMIGGGSNYTRLAAMVRGRGLEPLFRFLPYQERDRLGWSLTAPDMHWISLRPEAERVIVPSKFYGIAAAGRPIIAITARNGEIAALVERHGCGLVVAPGDGPGLAAALRGLSTDPAAVAAMGHRARAMLEDRFTRRAALAAWDELIDAIGDTAAVR